MALFSVVVGAVITAPALAASWLRLGWPARLASYLPLVGLLLVYERNVTGTDPSKPTRKLVEIFGARILDRIMRAGQIVRLKQNSYMLRNQEASE